MDKEYKFTLEQINSQLGSLKNKGITELVINDPKVFDNKKILLSLIKNIQEKEGDLFVVFCVSAKIIDKEVLTQATNIYCSFEIPLDCTEKGEKLLFDKSFYSSKAHLLNDYGIVFGFSLTYACSPLDSLKQFTERLDFAIQQYPNHIDFIQTQNNQVEAKVSGNFSAKDIAYCRDLSFACRTFYSAGRAVSWFLPVLKCLRIHPCKLFADFSEWQHCNNCDFKSGFVPENQVHKEIEKMQLVFLEQKLEEKKQSCYWQLVQDIVKINGAFSRLIGEGEESTLKTQYAPEDLLSYEALDLESFIENVCMHPTTCKICFEQEEAIYKIL